MLEWTWSGWRVSWAVEGVVELARFLDLPRSTVLSEGGDEDLEFLQLSEYPDANDVVLSLSGPKGTRVWRLCSGRRGFWPRLEALSSLEAMTPTSLPASLRLDELAAGLHIDLRRREVVGWSTDVLPRRDELFSASRWPGLRSEFYFDRFEEHERRVGGLTFEAEAETTYFEELISHSARMLELDHSDPTPRILGALRASGREVELVGPTHETRGGTGNASEKLELLEALRARFIPGVAPAERDDIPTV